MLEFLRIGIIEGFRFLRLHLGARRLTALSDQLCKFNKTPCDSLHRIRIFQRWHMGKQMNTCGSISSCGSSNCMWINAKRVTTTAASWELRLTGHGAGAEAEPHLYQK